MEDTIQKSTTNKIELYKTILKSNTGFVGILSDDSLDRDDEIISKSALNKMACDDGYLAVFVDHDTKAVNQIGEWVNKRVEFINGHNALVAELKFYDSHPTAQIIKNAMEKDGAQYGVSIGAIPKSTSTETINGKKYKSYDDLEHLEASIVGIPSNRSGKALAIAKSYNNFMEEKRMEEDAKLKIVELEKNLTDKDVELKDYVEKFKKLNADLEALQKESAEKAVAHAALEKALQDAKDTVLMKGNFTTEDGKVLKDSNVDVKGKLPILKKN